MGLIVLNDDIDGLCPLGSARDESVSFSCQSSTGCFIPWLMVHVHLKISKDGSGFNTSLTLILSCLPLVPIETLVLTLGMLC